MSLSHKKSNKKFLFLKTSIATAVAASVIAFSHGPVAFATSSKLTTIYHVYLNGTYIGNVTDKAVIDRVLAEKVDSMKASFQDKNLKIGSQVQYIPEQVFRAHANNLEAMQTLKNTFEIKAEASAIAIDGSSVVHLANKETAEQVIKQLKLQYVSQEQLTELEARKASPDTDLPPLAENETRLLDVRLSKNVSIDVENVDPEKVMSAEEAVTFLQRGTLEEKKYSVQEGDVLGTIAEKNGMTTADLIALNPGITEDTLLQIGQELNVTALQPYIEVIVDKEMNQQEAIPFDKEVVEDSSIPKGETKVKQEGQNGSKSVNYAISEQNGVTITKEVTSEQVVQEPVNQIVIKGTKVIPSRGEGRLIWPTVGGYISSQMGYRWGKMHKGIDIARPSNRTIKAADNGKVISAGWGGGYGNKVEIDHGNGFRTLYGHLASINVSVGQTVSQGQSIGIMGSTGDSTGVHLHFEVYKNGSLVNPLSYVNR